MPDGIAVFVVIEVPLKVEAMAWPRVIEKAFDGAVGVGGFVAGDDDLDAVAG